MRSRKPTGKTSHGDNIKWLDRDDLNYMKWYEEVRCHVLEHCTFYRRDRDEEGCEFEVFHSAEEMFDHYWCDHYYIMKEGVWYYSTGKEWVTLANALAAIVIEE